MKRVRLVAVGACAIDTILTVPHFPKEDSKLRAVSFEKRRGGNCPNSLEVLNQLVLLETARQQTTQPELQHSDSPQVPNLPELALVATLPARLSPQIPFILRSFDISTRDDTRQTSVSNIDFSHCLYRESHTEPVTSYIIADQSSGSRTIVNHNDLQEMSFDEFKAIADDLLSATDGTKSQVQTEIWFHFEGRIPATTRQCIQYLRSHHAVEGNNQVQSVGVKLKISVELEKPGREGLQELAHEADLIFYSKSWAEEVGYQTAEMCLGVQAKILGYDRAKMLVCTWGQNGACALKLPCQLQNLIGEIVHSEAYIPGDKAVIDTTGAGDTFIAGMLFAFMCRDDSGLVVNSRSLCWTTMRKLDFANNLAGRKVLQNGFRGLAQQIEKVVGTFDSESI